MAIGQEGDRRQNKEARFPLVDSNGVLVNQERRSGTDRRRNRRGSDIALHIMNIIKH